MAEMVASLEDCLGGVVVRITPERSAWKLLTLPCQWFPKSLFLNQIPFLFHLAQMMSASSIKVWWMNTVCEAPASFLLPSFLGPHFVFQLHQTSVISATYPAFSCLYACTCCHFCLDHFILTTLTSHFSSVNHHLEVTRSEGNIS